MLCQQCLLALLSGVVIRSDKRPALLPALLSVQQPLTSLHGNGGFYTEASTVYGSGIGSV